MNHIILIIPGSTSTPFYEGMDQMRQGELKRAMRYLNGEQSRLHVPALTFEFSLNYTKFATLPTKAYIGKTKMHSVKKNASTGY